MIRFVDNHTTSHQQEVFLHFNPKMTAPAALVLGILTGCSTMAPKYTPIPENINRLRDAGLEPVKVGEFTADNPTVNSLSIRGSSYVSPYEASYVNYVKEALKQELDEARLLNPEAVVEFSGTLMRNALNAAGFSKADAQIEVRFVAKRDGKVVFDKVKSAKFEWDSSFMGNVAIPRAAQNYPVVVQKVLTELYLDPDFISALKR